MIPYYKYICKRQHQKRLPAHKKGSVAAKINAPNKKHQLSNCIIMLGGREVAGGYESLAHGYHDFNFKPNNEIFPRTLDESDI